jgi:hypothetical protein
MKEIYTLNLGMGLSPEIDNTTQFSDPPELQLLISAQAFSLSISWE